MASGKVILLVGPTGVGKTGAAVLLAGVLGTEIISADSMQIYRHMDIGTEKPTEAQRGAIRHHIIDIVEPWEGYSAGRYVEDVKPIIDGLLEKGRTPVVVGGTGLYIKALTRGLFTGPEADWGLREELMKEAPEALYEKLGLIDPETARGIAPGDLRRIVRALEVFLKSGSRISELKEGYTAPLPYEFIKIGLSRERAELYRMIDERVDKMMKAGLIDEVRRLLELKPSQTPMQAIGYKEAAACLGGRYPVEEAVRLIKRNTRRYAKRQMTWFKKEEGVIWVDVTGIYEPSGVFEKLRESVIIH